MGKEILTFDNIEFQKNTFYRHKALFFLRNLDIEKVLVSNKTSFGEKAISTSLVTCIMVIKSSH